MNRAKAFLAARFALYTGVALLAAGLALAVRLLARGGGSAALALVLATVGLLVTVPAAFAIVMLAASRKPDLPPP